jgi:hypothetical protein
MAASCCVANVHLCFYAGDDDLDAMSFSGEQDDDQEDASFAILVNRSNSAVGGDYVENSDQEDIVRPSSKRARGNDGQDTLELIRSTFSQILDSAKANKSSSKRKNDDLSDD